MALSAKVRAVLLVLFGCFSVGFTIGAVDHWIVHPAFLRLQHTQAIEDLQRAHGALRSELRQLGRTLIDWSNWDDTYRFAQNANPEYLKDNFGNWPMLESGTKINLCIVLSDRGHVVYQGGYVEEQGGDFIPIYFSGGDAPGIEGLRPVWAEGQIVEGLLQTEAGLYLVGARPILTTAGSGPAHGALLMARRLSPTLLRTLAENVRVDFALLSPGAPSLNPSEQILFRELPPNRPWIDPQSSDPAFVYEIISDLGGKPAFLLRTPIRDDIKQVASETSHALIGALGLAAIALLIAVAWITRHDPHAEERDRGASAWTGTALVIVLGTGLTFGAFSELRHAGSRTPESAWLLVAGLVVTGFCAVYLYSLLAQRARTEALIERRTRQLADHEERLSGVIHHAPVGLLVFELQSEDALILTAANPAIEEILQRPFSQRLGRSLEDLLPAVGQTERPRIYRQLARDGGSRYWDAVSYEDDLVSRDYEITAFQSAPRTVTIMLADITERREAERLLQQRDHLLQATSAALGALLSEPTFETGIQTALGILGDALGADRAQVFQNAQDRETGKRQSQSLTAWQAAHIPPSQSDPALEPIDYDQVFSGWWECLSRGDSIMGAVSEQPAAARSSLAKQDIQSLLALPILIQGDFWGFIGFADCGTARVWTKAEDSLLRAVAAAIGHAYTRHQAQARQRLASAVFESVNESIIITDSERRILAVNPAFTEMTSYGEPEVLGRSPSFLKSGHHPDAYYGAVWTQIDRQGHWQGEFINRCKDGGLSVVLSTITAIHDDAGHLTNYVGTAHDITHRKEAEQQIERLAYFDPLTDLPNRSLLTQRAELALALANRNRRPLALLFMDLDAFKDVNDSLGHSEGDQLLMQAAVRLSSFTRGSDTLCRLGGDEFVLLLIDTDLQGAEDVALKILADFREPFYLAEHQPSVTLSIGIALAPQDGTTIADLLKNADIALYQAKANGRNTAVFFNQDMNRAALERLTLTTELREALVGGQLRAHYQPKVGLADGELLGAEALVRWEHPTQGMLQPGVFIPVAETSNLIVEIGDWMLAEVCRQLAAWRDLGYPPVRVAVNLAARHFRSPGLVERIADLLATHDLAGQWLALELTESTILDAGQITLDTLNALQALGVELAIDDFGTGYSSLTYLRDLPIDAVKIDRRFVRELPQRADDRAFASTIIALGHALGLVVIAEGVETEDQRAILLDQGCDQAQGFFFAQPESPNVFAEAWLAGTRPGTAPGVPVSMDGVRK